MAVGAHQVGEPLAGLPGAGDLHLGAALRDLDTLEAEAGVRLPGVGARVQILPASVSLLHAGGRALVSDGADILLRLREGPALKVMKYVLPMSIFHNEQSTKSYSYI